MWIVQNIVIFLTQKVVYYVYYMSLLLHISKCRPSHLDSETHKEMNSLKKQNFVT